MVIRNGSNWDSMHFASSRVSPVDSFGSGTRTLNKTSHARIEIICKSGTKFTSAVDLAIVPNDALDQRPAHTSSRLRYNAGSYLESQRTATSRLNQRFVVADSVSHADPDRLLNLLGRSIIWPVRPSMARADRCMAHNGSAASETQDAQSDRPDACGTVLPQTATSGHVECGARALPLAIGPAHRDMAGVSGGKWSCLS